MGYNGTIFAYGQTSSGKTHTMEGILGDPVQQGIIPRIVNDIFNHICSIDDDIEFQIKVSYFEIYLDKIRDLLDVSKTHLSVREDKNRVPYVKGATERFVTSPEEMMEIIEEGKSNGHIAVTNINERSSRSHCVLLINIKQENLENQRKLSGKLYLVDLAGSEKICTSGAKGMVLDETKHINKSLSALGNVISALADGNKSHIPYRDSKLTRILQESLGGNSRTTIILCCSPASYNERETKLTLEFGRRAKTIKNTVIVNVELTAEEWKWRYETEKKKVAKLKGQISRAEVELNRWRNGESVPQDEQLLTKDLESSTLSLAETSSFLNIPVTIQVSAEPLSNDERVKFEEERARLYTQLDEKDDDIDWQSQLFEKLKEQMLEQEELISSIRRDFDLNSKEISRLQQENYSAKEEVKEVLQVLEELAVNYDQKSEVDTKDKDFEILNEEFSQKMLILNSAQSELQQLKGNSLQQKKSMAEILTNILKDLYEISVVLGGNVMDIQAMGDLSGKVEEFTIVRLYISKMKSEVKILSQRCSQLESLHVNSNKKIENNEKELAECRLLISQYEAKFKTLQETIKSNDNKNRNLDEKVDSLNEECAAMLLAAKEIHVMAPKENEKDSVEKVKEALEQQIEKHKESHQNQLANLQDKLVEEQAEIGRLKDVSQKLCLAQERLQLDCNKLTYKEQEKTQQLTFINDHGEQAILDLKGLEETVVKKLQIFHSMQKLSIQDLQSIKQSAIDDDNEDTGSSATKKQKISFLEYTLDRLTEIRKQVVRDNADMQRDVPTFKKRFMLAMERVKMLEKVLKEAKESAMKDQNKPLLYQHEIDRNKEAARQKDINR